jgi:hypothetical protein
VLRTYVRMEMYGEMWDEILGDCDSKASMLKGRVKKDLVIDVIGVRSKRPLHIIKFLLPTSGPIPRLKTSDYPVRLTLALDRVSSHQVHSPGHTSYLLAPTIS